MTGQMFECHCSPGWQGLECEKPCGSTSSGRLDLSRIKKQFSVLFIQGYFFRKNENVSVTF